MTPGKRLMDIALVLVLFVLLVPVIALTALLVAFIDGRPVFYRSERMMTPSRAFRLWKFRTMTTAHDDSGVTGGDKSARITPLGSVLRRHRLDELPQLLNILRGEMSFVGPRPPLRAYVDRHPDLYARVLRHRPGVTGLATLRYHDTEERLLAACTTPEETDRVYNARCVPRKARLDLIWAARRNLCFDLLLLIETGLPRRRGRRHAG